MMDESLFRAALPGTGFRISGFRISNLSPFQTIVFGGADAV
ncbi:MAG: hypothetical protein AB1586_14210 [Pseudomonadota bacterium]|jgi:hypothetical protein